MVAVSLKKKIFFKQKTAYEISTRDWSSDVCSSDLVQKNKVTGCPCPAIVVTSVDGLKMSDNEVENSKELTRSHGERYGADTGAPVWEKNNIKK